MINPFKKSYTQKELNTFRFLSRIKLFERLNYKEMAHFLPYFYLREYKMDEVVFFRNDPGNALYLVKSGKISINIDIEDSGPGIPDIDKAMQPGFSTASEWVRELGFGAGMGLVNIKKCADDFKLTSEVGKGTHIKITLDINRTPHQSKQGQQK